MTNADTWLTLASVLGAMAGAGVAAYQARQRQKRRRRKPRRGWDSGIR